MYRLLRPGLFALDAERSHDAVLAALARAAPAAYRLYGARVPATPVRIMGLDLPNPVGLAAGLDKNGDYIDALAALGFGFIEIGTVTPRPQPGNARPRLFRVVASRAIVNRMGFNNDGVAALAARVRAARYRGVLGINIGVNANTPASAAVADYLAGLRAVYALASYVAINVSSPNTHGLRDLQGRDRLDALLAALASERDTLAGRHGRRMPLALKISPDLDSHGLDAIADRVLHHRIDAVIATNTTVARDGLAPRWRAESGGVSGAPLAARSTAVVAALYRRLGDAVPIIGAGGIGSARDALDKLAAGARAIQLYSGLIYRGPSLIRDCAAAARRA